MNDRDISERLRGIKINMIVSKYINLIAQYNTFRSQANDLNEQALEVQRSANKLQEERFHLLTNNLRAISKSLSNIYQKIVPGADCYINYATNPISLFEDGISMLALHGQSSWQEVSHSFKSIYSHHAIQQFYHPWLLGKNTFWWSASCLLFVSDSCDSRKFPLSNIHHGRSWRITWHIDSRKSGLSYQVMLVHIYNFFWRSRW